MTAAFQHIFAHSGRLGTETRTVDTKLSGHVLAEDVIAQIDVPSGPSTNVDGYAVKASQGAGEYPVYTAATHASGPLPAGSICRINTGAVLPEGTDAVIMVEDTEVSSRTQDGEEKEVRIEAVATGENVRLAGSDIRKGSIALQKGVVIEGTGGEVASLAFIGKRDVMVYRKPVIAVLSTGNELSDITAPPGPSSSVIYDTNRPALRSALSAFGFEIIDLGIVGDTVAATTETLRAGLRQADVLLTTGGTSMGDADLLKPVIERELGGEVHFGRVAMKPGKPTTFATARAGDGAEKIIFALPGNPASALVTLFVFVLPALRKMSGFPEQEWHLPVVPVQIASDFALDTRPEFHRVRIVATPSGLIAHSTGGQRSSRASSLAGANGLVKLPAVEVGQAGKALRKGEMAEAILIGQIAMSL